MDQSTHYQFSSFSKRFFAFILDEIFAVGISAIFFLIFQILSGKTYNLLDEKSGFGNFANLITISYFILLTYFYNATLGKMLLKIKVVNTNYQKLSFIQVLIRELIGKFISGLIFGLGYIWVIFDDKKQGWHDKIAKTYVINTEPISHGQYLELHKDKRSNLPLVLIIAGLFESILPLISIFLVIPKLAPLYSEISGSSLNLLVNYGLFGIILIISTAQIMYGALLINNQRKNRELSDSQKKIGKILIVTGAISTLVSIPIMVMAILLPIYRLITSF